MFSKRFEASGRRLLQIFFMGAVCVLFPQNSSWAQEDTSATPGAVLTLDEAVSTALAYQPVLRQARAAEDAAAGRVEQAKAGYLPQVNGTGTYQRTTGNFAQRPGATTNNQASPSWNGTTFNYFNFGVTGSQLIYDFGQTRGRWKAAEASRQAAAANEQTNELQVVLGVRRAYFQARAQQDLAAVAAEAEANQRKHLKQIQAFVTAGMRAEIDLASARTDVANARVVLIDAENKLALARAQLAQSMGVQMVGSRRLDNEDPPVVLGEDDDNSLRLTERALKQRPEAESFARAIAAQEAVIAGYRGAYGPSLGATAGATEAGTNLGSLVPNWFLGANITWPFLQGGLTRGQVHEAHANLESLQAQLGTLKLQVEVDIEQGRLAVRAAKATLLAADEALTSAREQLRLAEGRYEQGLGSVIELGDAQVTQTNAAAQAVSAHYNLATARALLLSALGLK